MKEEEVATFIDKNLKHYLNFSSKTIPGYGSAERFLELKGPITKESYLEIKNFFIEDTALTGLAIYICFHDQIPGRVEVCRSFDLSADLSEIVQLFHDRPADQNGDESCLILSSDFKRVYYIENSREDGRATMTYAHRAEID